MSQTSATEQREFTVRNARPSDAEAINHLCVEAYAEFRGVIGETNWKRLRETLSKASSLINEGELLVAESASGVVGIVLYIPPRQEKGGLPKSAWLQTLAVSPLHRGQGVGGRLTRECIERARRDGADSIGLTTAEMMTVARPMYERLGFTKESDLGQRFGVPHGRYVLKLRSEPGAVATG
jgi:ribosomal protein S18 acetylase RimI-like enzyme